MLLCTTTPTRFESRCAWALLGTHISAITVITNIYCWLRHVECWSFTPTFNIPLNHSNIRPHFICYNMSVIATNKIHDHSLGTDSSSILGSTQNTSRNDGSHMNPNSLQRLIQVSRLSTWSAENAQRLHLLEDEIFFNLMCPSQFSIANYSWQLILTTMSRL